MDIPLRQTRTFPEICQLRRQSLMISLSRCVVMVMSEQTLLLSEKYKAFIRCNAPVEFLEGTTAAGKTTVGLFKFMLKVEEPPKKLHIIAADDTGAAEKNIINKDLGIVDDFGVL